MSLLSLQQNRVKKFSKLNDGNVDRRNLPKKFKLLPLHFQVIYLKKVNQISWLDLVN